MIHASKFTTLNKKSTVILYGGPPSDHNLPGRRLGFPMFRFATIGINFSLRFHFALLNKKAPQRLAML
jgi:hypothetical protein